MVIETMELIEDQHIIDYGVKIDGYFVLSFQYDVHFPENNNMSKNFNNVLMIPQVMEEVFNTAKRDGGELSIINMQTENSSEYFDWLYSRP